MPIVLKYSSMIVKKRELSNQAPFDARNSCWSAYPLTGLHNPRTVGTRLINQLTGKAEGTHQSNIEAPYNHSVQHHQKPYCTNSTARPAPAPSIFPLSIQHGRPPFSAHTLLKLRAAGAAAPHTRGSASRPALSRGPRGEDRQGRRSKQWGYDCCTPGC